MKEYLGGNVDDSVEAKNELYKRYTNEQTVPLFRPMFTLFISKVATVFNVMDATVRKMAQ